MVLLPTLVETQSCNILIVTTAWVGSVSARGESLHRGTSHTGEVLPEEGSHSHSFPIPPQIAPAEGPDASERMVIITGPPEAQFKV